MTILAKGSSAKFIELDQHDTVRRFIVPEIEGLEGRLANFIKKYPNVSLVRIGRAIVASEDGAVEFKDGLEGVPSTVSGSYVIDLCGDHPILGQGPARYSEELVNELAHTNIIPTEPIKEEQGQVTLYDLAPNQGITPNGVTYSMPPKPDLAASLRAQMNKQEQKEASTSLQDLLNAQLQKKKEEVVPQKVELEIVRTEGAAHVTPKPDYPRFPHLKKDEHKISQTQLELNAAIERARNKREAEMTSPREQIRIMEPKPLGKIDMVLEKVTRIENMLYDGLIPEDSEAITGEELQEWFYQHLDTIGHEKTFSILASRLKVN